jgi:hypothetical protein
MTCAPVPLCGQACATQRHAAPRNKPQLCLTVFLLSRKRLCFMLADWATLRKRRRCVLIQRAIGSQILHTEYVCTERREVIYERKLYTICFGIFIS